MGALADWPDCQTNLMRRAATTAVAPGDGQPGWTPDGVLCGVAVRTRDYAAVHTAERIVVEHDRSQANAKLVFRTVLTIDGPEGARHFVPLRRRKSVNPLVRR